MFLSRDEINNIHFFCSIIELIARETNNHRSDVIERFTLADIQDELELAEVNHCLPVERVVDEYINDYGISEGNFQHVPEFCKVFTYSQIGRILEVYIVAEVENLGRPLAQTTKQILSRTLEELFATFD